MLTRISNTKRERRNGNPVFIGTYLSSKMVISIWKKKYQPKERRKIEFNISFLFRCRISYTAPSFSIQIIWLFNFFMEYYNNMRFPMEASLYRHLFEDRGLITFNRTYSNQHCWKIQTMSI